MNTGQRVRKEFEAKLEEVRRAGEEDVHLRMDAGTKRIMQQNRSLQEELRIHIEVSHCSCVWHGRFPVSVDMVVLKTRQHYSAVHTQSPAHCAVAISMSACTPSPSI